MGGKWLREIPISGACYIWLWLLISITESWFLDQGLNLLSLQMAGGALRAAAAVICRLCSTEETRAAEVTPVEQQRRCEMVAGRREGAWRQEPPTRSARKGRKGRPPTAKRVQRRRSVVLTEFQKLPLERVWAEHGEGERGGQREGKGGACRKGGPLTAGDGALSSQGRRLLPPSPTVLADGSGKAAQSRRPGDSDVPAPGVPMGRIREHREEPCLIDQTTRFSVTAVSGPHAAPP